MPSITSPKGHVALIDEADAYLCEMRWNSHAQGSSPARVYFKRHVWVNGKQVHMSLHRVIMGLMLGDPRKVDHINGDTLDNRRANLRVVSNIENSRNLGPRVDLGVGWMPSRGKYRARINVNGSRVALGYFFTKEEAVAARLAAERRFWGDQPRRAALYG